ncbi:hypothetical protein [Sphingopyxis sp.]|jgi:hypothetical protein|uniref:hypothetical protein n=1 Tax=Sphingopyxis sp. TaxID=1908224 RepID=UPI002E0652A1|nr:hypothetical protein [Sphingopyxis sp.]
MKKAKKANSAALVRAARRLVGHDDETPVTDEELAIMDEVRREHARPSKEEIRAEAKRLLKRG